MEHLERHGFLRRGIVRHARLSLQLRNQSARPLAQATSWRRHSSPPLPPGVGSRLQAPGSRLQAPGSTTYGTSRRHHPVLLGRAPQALGSWPCHALRTSRSATEGPVGGCGAALGPGQRRRLCGVPPPGPRLRVQQHALASPQTQAQYLDLGDGLTKCCSLQGCFRCGTSSTVPVTSIHGKSVSQTYDVRPLYILLFLTYSNSRSLIFYRYFKR